MGGIKKRIMCWILREFKEDLIEAAKAKAASTEPEWDDAAVEIFDAALDTVIDKFC